MTDPSFEEFARASMPGLKRYAYALVGGIDASEDLLQDTLVKLARAWRRVQDDGNPVAYARTVMLRTYLNGWRSRLRRPRTVELVDEHSAPDPYAGADARDLIARALARLPRDQRAVLVLSYLDDLPDEEIGSILQRRPATVRSLRYRALTTLRQHLTSTLPEGIHGPR